MGLGGLCTVGPIHSAPVASKHVQYLRQEAVAVSRWCILSTAGSERV